MNRTAFRSLATATTVTGLLLLGNGIAAAQDDNADVGVNLPVDQQVVSAHNTETGYSIELFPTNGNNHAQPLQSAGDIQVPIHLPANLCGNSIDIVGLLNPTFGNTCVNK